MTVFCTLADSGRQPRGCGPEGQTVRVLSGHTPLLPLHVFVSLPHARTRLVARPAPAISAITAGVLVNGPVCQFISGNVEFPGPVPLRPGLPYPVRGWLRSGGGGYRHIGFQTLQARPQQYELANLTARGSGRIPCGRGRALSGTPHAYGSVAMTWTGPLGNRTQSWSLPEPRVTDEHSRVVRLSGRAAPRPCRFRCTGG